MVYDAEGHSEVAGIDQSSLSHTFFVHPNHWCVHSMYEHYSASGRRYTPPWREATKLGRTVLLCRDGDDAELPEWSGHASKSRTFYHCRRYLNKNSV